MKNTMYFLTLILSILFVFSRVPFANTAEAKAKQVNIKLLASTFGGLTYRLSFGLTELINKHHPYIRAAAHETRGSIENQMTMLKRSETRKDTIFASNDLGDWMAYKARPPFKSPYTTGRVIAKMFDTGAMLLFTLDKNIRTKDDLIGKRIATLGPEHTASQMYDILINKIWKIGDKVKIIRTSGWSDITDYVRDGLADAGLTALTTIFGRGKWFAQPALRELLEMKDVYFVQIPKPDIEKLIEIADSPLVFSEVSAGKVGKRQLSAGSSYGHSNEWWADAAMDEGIVYEITKIISEHIAEFKNYHGMAKLWKIKYLPDTPLPDEKYHPGAIRLYKEKGVWR